MNKKKLVELRCKAWGITEDKYYCNQCSDFSLEDMARAYRRGKNKGRAELEKQIAELKSRDCWKSCEYANPKAELIGQHIKDVQNLTEAKEYIKKLLKIINDFMIIGVLYDIDTLKQAEQFLSEVEK